MTDLLSDVETPSDAELISRVRGGDVAAYGDLFSRHKEAANRLARQLARGPDSDDLVSEAFAKVLIVLQGGGGPDVAFRAYLLTAVRRLHVDRIRSAQRLQTTDDLTPFDPGVPFQDTAVAGFESGAAAKAFASLPERWQLVLWHLEVEGQKPADIAPLLGMSANSVSALAYRAREGLRQAFLTMHISDLSDTDCRWVNEHLGAFIRKGLSKRDSGKVQSHLDECRRCTAMYLELTEVNSNLAGIIAPLLLGAAATGYLASSGAGAVGILGLFVKVKEFVGANAGAVAAAGVSAAVVAAAVAAVTLSGGGDNKPDVIAEVPVGTSSTGPASPGTTVPSPGKAAKPSAKTSPSSSPSPSASSSASPAVGAPAAGAPAVGAPAVGAPAVVSPIPVAPDSPSVAGPDQPPADGSTDTPGGGNGPSVIDVRLDGTTIDDQGVHLRLTGSPNLPPTATVVLQSDPAGVTFAGTGNCDARAGSVRATCSTLPAAGGAARIPATAKMAAPTSYAAELPFDTTQAEDGTELSITVEVPHGYRVTIGATGLPSHRFHRPPPTVDVGMDPFDPENPTPDKGGLYHANTHFSVAGVVPPLVTFSIRGSTAATFHSVTGCQLPRPGGQVIICDTPANGSSIDVVLEAPTDVTTDLTVAVDALGFDDAKPDDNARKLSLQAKPAPATRFGFVGDATATRDEGGESWTVTATVEGVPSGAELLFELEHPAQFACDAKNNGKHESDDEPPPRCQTESCLHPRTMTCTPETSGHLSIRFRAELPGLSGGRPYELGVSVVGDDSNKDKAPITVTSQAKPSNQIKRAVNRHPTSPRTASITSPDRPTPPRSPLHPADSGPASPKDVPPAVGRSATPAPKPDAAPQKKPDHRTAGLPDRKPETPPAPDSSASPTPPSDSEPSRPRTARDHAGSGSRPTGHGVRGNAGAGGSISPPSAHDGHRDRDGAVTPFKTPVNKAR